MKITAARHTIAIALSTLILLAVMATYAEEMTTRRWVRAQAQKPVSEILSESLPDAWKGEETTAIAVATALSQKSGQNLPWPVVREAIDGALRSHYVERAVDSGPWPCELAGASVVKLKVPSGGTPPPPPPPKPSGMVSATAEIKPNQIQDLAESVGDIVTAAAGHDLKFTVTV